MKNLAIIACIATIMLFGCASPSPPRHITLEDGRPRLARSSSTPSVAVIRADVPERIDRPQLVFRSEGNQVLLSEQYRWAEPLRREIPRVIASDLGELLDSRGVVALSADVDGFSPDYKLKLDFQQLDAIIGQGAEVDVLWRLEHRSGNVSVGRSSFMQRTAEEAGGQPALITAQREALRRVAADIANEITVYQKCRGDVANGNNRTENNLALCTVVNSTAFR